MPGYIGAQTRRVILAVAAIIAMVMGCATATAEPGPSPGYYDFHPYDTQYRYEGKDGTFTGDAIYASAGPFGDNRLFWSLRLSPYVQQFVHGTMSCGASVSGKPRYHDLHPNQSNRRYLVLLREQQVVCVLHLPPGYPATAGPAAGATQADQAVLVIVGNLKIAGRLMSEADETRKVLAAHGIEVTGSIHTSALTGGQRWTDLSLHRPRDGIIGRLFGCRMRLQ